MFVYRCTRQAERERERDRSDVRELAIEIDLAQPRELSC